jgi:peptide/nickel transport system substrate-binding protein
LRRRELLRLGLGGAAAAALASAPDLRGGSAEAAAPAPTVRRGGTLAIGTAQPIQTLDPHQSGLRNNRNAWMGLFSFLTLYNEQGFPKPSLAELWQVSGDGLTWTFRLRRGVRFHNGRELTADDVKFSVERVLEKKPSAVYPLIKPVQRVDVADRYTARVVLSQPHSVLASALAPVAIIARENADQVATKAIGTGPFRLKEYNVGQNCDLERFPGYWEKGPQNAALPYLDAVSIRTLTDTNALFTALTTNTVQAFWQMPDQIQVQAAAVPQIQLLPARFKTTHDEYFFQSDAPPFSQKTARQALLLALDKVAIAQAGYFGHADPRLNNNIMPPGNWAERTDLPEIRRDPARAKELFAQAGVTRLKFLGYTETPQFKPISQVMERNLNEIGIQLELVFTDLTTWLARIKLGNQSAAWGDGQDGGAFTPNISVTPPDPGLAVATWGCHAHFGSHFCDEDLASAAAEGSKYLEIVKRRAAYHKYQQIWQTDVPAFITCFRAFTHAAVKKVHSLYDDDGALNYRYAWMEA